MLRTVLPPAPSYPPVVADVVALSLTVLPVWVFLTAGSILMAWRDPEHRAAHDRLAGTRVLSAARA